jgi:hypothetical protein
MLTGSCAIEAGKVRLVRAYFEFIDEALIRASSALENAILVSYLVNVFGFNAPKTARARNFLTQKLALAVYSVENHFIAKFEGTLPSIDRNSNAHGVAGLERRRAEMTDFYGATS